MGNLRWYLKTIVRPNPIYIISCHYCCGLWKFNTCVTFVKVWLTHETKVNMSRLVDNLLLVCFALGRQLFEQDDSMRDSDAAFLESKLSTIFHSEIFWQWIHINAQDTKKSYFVWQRDRTEHSPLHGQSPSVLFNPLAANVSFIFIILLLFFYFKVK